MLKLIATLFTIVGLLAGNYFYQAILATTPNYEIAFERSLFQAIACFSLWINFQFLVPEKTREITNDRTKNGNASSNPT